MRRLNSLSIAIGLAWAVVELGACSDGGAAQQPSSEPTSATTRGGGSGVNPTGTGGVTSVVQIGGTSGGNPCLGDNPPDTCNMVAPPGCGDGENNQDSEECDDGNALPGDGCNGICKVERNWTCPPAGACTRNVICGDGVIGAGEVCDDKNTIDNDGCSSTCTVQDPQFQCTAGAPCRRLATCGDGRVQTGETCEDGNTTGGDGCSSTCTTEAGWTCRTPGQSCTPAPRCGDGKVTTTLGEVCDDGNVADGDGCAADCRAKGAGCVCTPGQLCTCPQPQCGNGKLEGDEQCDDRNTNSGDGCSSSCKLESGYECPFIGALCVTNCGDGVVTSPAEECDPGNTSVANMDKACTSTCQWADGWACEGTPLTCHATTCGDNKQEGTESCDDGNSDMGDGCSALCKIEPDCPDNGGACTSGCGDGLLLPQPAEGTVLRPGADCDDGNSLDGDGCSASCKVEDGFECSQPALGDKMYVPLVVHDFKRGGDFEPGNAIGQNVAVTGLVQNTLNAQGKPVFAGTAGQAYITGASSFAQWYVDVPGTNSVYRTQMVLFNNGQGAYVNRWKNDGTQWATYTNPQWCANTPNCPSVSEAPVGEPGCPTPIDGAGPTCVVCGIAWGNTNTTQSCSVTRSLMDGSPAFFPLDGVAGMITPTSEYATAQIPRPYDKNWIADPSGVSHNFHFTSEVRYWFTFKASTSYVLDFTGDDDVWVFINKRLAVDLGGIHTPVSGRIELNAQGGGTVTITQTEPDPPPTPIVQSVSLGLEDGGVYEIVVFQAERKVTASTYKLTLSGFNAAATACKPICGNGVVTAGEQCDNGDQNLGGYNQCTAECKLGPFCGDGNVDSPEEECDNKTNNDEYGANGGCAPNCKLPARCGDGLIQIEWGEECDNGSSNVDDTSGVPYGTDNCGSTKCQRGGFCGDAVTGGPEYCDDGKNDGTYNTCGENCTPPPRCGDGVVQSEWGEECEPTSSGDKECTQACRKPGVCGDGMVQAELGEQCDDPDGNDGEYGGCAPSCLYAPHCGDGIKNGPEECDDGINDNSYGGCSETCRLGPHCGDGLRQEAYEQCDDGAQNGVNFCTTECKNVVFTTE